MARCGPAFYDGRMPAPRRSRSIEVRPTGDFDLAWTLGFLGFRQVPSIECVSGSAYSRTVSHDGNAHVVTVRGSGPGASQHCDALTARANPSLLPAALRAIVTRMFDLDRDLTAFLAVAGADPLLHALVHDRPAIRLPRLVDLFEAIVRAIVGQQVSVSGATTVVDRLVRRFGTPIDDRLFRFPTPAQIGSADIADITPLGLTRAKAAALVGSGRAMRDGVISRATLETATPEQAQCDLDALPGIGPWTASYVRLRALGDPDVFLEGDLGVLKALQKALGRDRLVRPAEALAIAERWRPWRSYATVHLWRSLG